MEEATMRNSIILPSAPFYKQTYYFKYEYRQITYLIMTKHIFYFCFCLEQTFCLTVTSALGLRRGTFNIKLNTNCN